MRVACKGAPEAVAELCRLSPEARALLRLTKQAQGVKKRQGVGGANAIHDHNRNVFVKQRGADHFGKVGLRKQIVTESAAPDHGGNGV